jgi:cold shock protein
MARGTVKWFNPTKGYGFIQPQAGGKDVFVHISAVERAGLSTLNEGQQIEYEIEENRGKTSAVNLKVKYLLMTAHAREEPRHAQRYPFP